MKKILIVFIISWSIQSGILAQGPVVPTHLEFAGMELRLNESLRKEIQTEVDALMRSEKYFNIKLERAKQYFPIIEKIFKEENIPDDIKYLVIQESALISDAVSSSDAVGFWQFKEASGKEVGLRIDRQVDERLNIVSATRGASSFLKTNNFYFKNWVYSVLAYNTGRGGADKYIQDKYIGAHRMELDNDTHWYVKKFLAHMIAFGSRLKESGDSRIHLYEYTNAGGKTLDQLAVELKVMPDELIMYNKWLKTNRVPDDKTYAVIVPGMREIRPLAVKIKQETVTEKASEKGTEKLSPNMAKYPVIGKTPGKNGRIIKINGINGVIGAGGDEIQGLASLGGIPIGQFIKYNDIGIEHNIIDGQVYYLKHKNNKAKEYYHTLLPGETLWMISQKYGIKLDRLLIKNRMSKNSPVRSGMVLYIRYIRPESEEIQYNPVPYVSTTPVAVAIQVQDTMEILNTRKENPANIEQSAQPRDSVSIPIGENPATEDDLAIEDTSVATGNFVAYDSTTDIPLFHIVAEGETLYGISRKYHLSIDALMEINEIVPGENIRIGQQLYLKKPDAGIEMKEEKGQNAGESYITYEVRKGDTLYNLSKKFNVSIQDIMEWNNKDSMELGLGEILKIYNQKI